MEIRNRDTLAGIAAERVIYPVNGANLGTGEARVQFRIGGADVNGSPFTISQDAIARPKFPGVDAGPVRIESDQDIVASARMIYLVNGRPTSFSEMIAMPQSQLGITYWLPWYNNVNLHSQLLFGAP